MTIEAFRCSCHHVMSRHSLAGCQYCGCKRQSTTMVEDIERVAANLEALGLPEAAAEVRAYWLKRESTV